MFSIRTVNTGLTLIAVAKAMSAAAGSSDPPGLCLPGNTVGVCPDSPPRLLRLPAVPGYEQHRVNDLLLHSPSTGSVHRCGSSEMAGSGNAHIVFFPGDIQVSIAIESISTLEVTNLP